MAPIYSRRAVAKMTGLPDKLTETPESPAIEGRPWMFSTKS
ncbi:hypothetical protein [Sphingomonas sp.]|nr:hypothetical protein [Sphingomonas sp.]